MMKWTLHCFTLAIIGLLWSPVHAHESSDHPQTSGAEGGYVLRPGEGESIPYGEAKIKASPESGTNGAVVIEEVHAPDFQAGLHYHIYADEFFYVTQGGGKMIIGDDEFSIEPGDFVFVPAGVDHDIIAGSEGVRTMTFLDKPGLDQEFRYNYSEEGELTLERFNEIVRPFGQVYKSFEPFLP